MDTPTRAQLQDRIDLLVSDPMGYVIDGLRERPESSLTIAEHVEVSASTIRALRNGAHNGNLRVDVWAELARWLMDTRPE